MATFMGCSQTDCYCYRKAIVPGHLDRQATEAANNFLTRDSATGKKCFVRDTETVPRKRKKRKAAQVIEATVTADRMTKCPRWEAMRVRIAERAKASASAASH